MKIGYKNLQGYSLSIRFKQTEDGIDIHEELYDRLASSSLKEYAEMGIDGIGVNRLTGIVKAAIESLPLIRINIGNMLLHVRTSSIEIRFGNPDIPGTSSMELTKISKKDLETGSKTLAQLLLALSGLTEISELQITCKTMFIVDSNSAALKPILNEVLVDTAEKIGYEIGVNDIDLSFKIGKDENLREYSVAVDFEIPPHFKEFVDKYIWRCNLKKTLPLVAVDLHGMLDEIIQFTRQTSKMLGL